MAVRHAFQNVPEVGERLHVVELSGGQQRGDDRPARRTASDPANRWFLRPSAMGRMARSTVLLSSWRRPSSRNRQRALQRVSRAAGHG
jgi:hypothetical protein